jgi:hypothetical protein
MRIILITLIILLISISSTVFSQEANQSSKLSERKLEAVTDFSGQLTGWADNVDYIYGGFYLQTCNSKYLVVFSPTIGRKLRKKVKSNTLLSIKGVEKVSAKDEKEIWLVCITTNEETIYNPSLGLSTKKGKEKFVLGVGKINELQKDGQGKTIGIILNDQTILRMSNSMLELLNKIALVGTTISYTGEKQKLPSGEVALMNYTVINCHTITIDGSQYLTN